MICYRDMTFCEYWESCKNGKDCYRKLTDLDKKRAKELNLPISCFMQKPDCYERMEDNVHQRVNY